MITIVLLMILIGKHTGATVLLKSAPDGTGIIAGGPARSVCDLAGIQNIRTKSLGSSNKQNVVLLLFQHFQRLKSLKRLQHTR